MAYYAFHEGYKNEKEYQTNPQTKIFLYDINSMKFSHMPVEIRNLGFKRCKIVNLDKRGLLQYHRNFPSVLKNNAEELTVIHDVRLQTVIFGDDTENRISFLLSNSLGSIYQHRQKVWGIPGDDLEISLVYEWMRNYTVRVLVTDSSKGIYREPVYFIIQTNIEQHYYVAYDESLDFKLDNYRRDFIKLKNFEQFLVPGFTDFVVDMNHYRIDDNLFVNCDTGELDKDIPFMQCFNVARDGGRIAEVFFPSTEYYSSDSNKDTYIRVGCVKAVMQKRYGMLRLEVNGNRHRIRREGTDPYFTIQYDGVDVFNSSWAYFAIEYIYKVQDYIIVSFEKGMYHFVLDLEGNLISVRTESNELVEAIYPTKKEYKGKIARLLVTGIPISTLETDI